MNLRKKDRCIIGLICHNPSIIEIWQNHPKASKLDIRNPGYCWPPGRLGLPEDNLPKLGNNDPIIVYPHEKDKEILNNVPEKYIVMNCGAGMNERTYPQEIVDNIVKSLDGWTIYGIGANYKRNDRNSEVTYPEPVINLVDKMSVPGCMELIKSCRGLVTAHSAGHCMGNHYQPWQLLLYPQSVKDKYPYWQGKVGHIYSHGTWNEYKTALNDFMNKIKVRNKPDGEK
jgi:ADP-heptose:LPS heptosyltransferase